MDTLEDQAAHTHDDSDFSQGDDAAMDMDVLELLNTKPSLLRVSEHMDSIPCTHPTCLHAHMGTKLMCF